MTADWGPGLFGGQITIEGFDDEFKTGICSVVFGGLLLGSFDGFLVFL
jgi:hypothetical protein